MTDSDEATSCLTSLLLLSRNSSHRTPPGSMFMIPSETAYGIPKARRYKHATASPPFIFPSASLPNAVAALQILYVTMRRVGPSDCATNLSDQFREGTLHHHCYYCDPEEAYNCPSRHGIGDWYVSANNFVQLLPVLTARRPQVPAHVGIRPKPQSSPIACRPRSFPNFR